MEQAPVTPVPPPAPAKRRIPFGSFIVAILIGVAITIAGLYAWGSEIEREMQVGQTVE